MSGDDIAQFMEQRRFILSLLREILPALHGDRSKERLAKAARVPDLMVFGDTFAVTWVAPSPHPFTFLRELQEFASAISSVIALAFISGLRLRGALAYGEFYFDTNVIIGPAVADAAVWCEQAQCMGVIATPSTKTVVQKTLNDPAASIPDPEANLGSLQDLLLPLRQDFVRIFLPPYDVPFKKGVVRSMMCINWPYTLFCLGPDITSLTGEHIGTFFRRKLDAFTRPASAEIKYENTRAFYQFCVAYMARVESKSFMLGLQRQITSDTPVTWLPGFLKRYAFPETGAKGGGSEPEGVRACRAAR